MLVLRDHRGIQRQGAPVVVPGPPGREVVREDPWLDPHVLPAESVLVHNHSLRHSVFRDVHRWIALRPGPLTEQGRHVARARAREIRPTSGRVRRGDRHDGCPPRPDHHGEDDQGGDDHLSDPISPIASHSTISQTQGRDGARTGSDRENCPPGPFRRSPSPPLVLRPTEERVRIARRGDGLPYESAPPEVAWTVRILLVLPRYSMRPVIIKVYRNGASRTRACGELRKFPAPRR